ncbi:hypothetical protein HN51_015521, partial [Arachis hypogaea]
MASLEEKVNTCGVGVVAGVRKTLNSELWHACTGPFVSLPQVKILIYYLSQGHSEEAGQEAIARIRVLEQLEGNHLSSAAILRQDSSVWVCLVRMYFRCEKIELAWRVFDESSERDHVGSVHFDSTAQGTCSCVLAIMLPSFFLYLCHFEPNPTKDPLRRALGPEPDIVDLKKKDESRQQPIL